jgi:CopA family copper-resistance protein
MDRTGYTRGTLAPREGMQAPVPPPDPRVWLDPTDMMGAMAAMSDARGGHGIMGMMEMKPARHARTEYGPSTDMRVDYPRNNLDDPGAGLRNNGRRVLTYADLRTEGGSRDPRSPDREIELHLTGNMERFMWSLDGVALNDSKPVHFRTGERLRLMMVNDSTMTHPMHLHGMWTEIEDPEGGFLARKHTVSVQPAQRVNWLVTADAPGRWAFHCHLLYHMAAGMFREVVVA